MRIKHAERSLSYNEAAMLFGVTVTTITNWLKRGKLLRDGHHISIESAMALLRERRSAKNRPHGMPTIGERMRQEARQFSPAKVHV